MNVQTALDTNINRSNSHILLPLQISRISLRSVLTSATAPIAHHPATRPTNKETDIRAICLLVQMRASGSEMMTGVCALDTLMVSSSTVTTTSWCVGTGDSVETWEDILGSPDVCHF